MIDRQMADALSGVTQAFSGNGLMSEVLKGFTIVVILYLVMAISEYVYKSFTQMWKGRLELFPHTYLSGPKMYTAVQNPSDPNAQTILFSDNQRSGVEFSYAMFINLSSDTFTNGNHYLYHILHKGYSRMFPLMSPGIFSWGDKNTIRVYMNCFNTWNNYCEIDNIPVNNWFHLVVSCKGNVLYVYLNGNLKQKLTMSGNTPPYQNYGNVYMFNSRKLTINASDVSSLHSESSSAVQSNTTSSSGSLVFDGSAKGSVSSVSYSDYALTYSEIQSMINTGPTATIVQPVGGSDPSSPESLSRSQYLADTWWTTNGTRM